MGKKLIRSVILAVLAAGTIVLGVGCAMTLPTLDPAKLETPDTVTTIFDNKGQQATQIRLEKGEAVDYKNLPNYVKQAIVATEDRQFYEHNGVNYRSIARALYRDILAGGAVEGGSTITQQLAKNAVLKDSDKTFSRKLSEIAMAAQLEREYTKEDILEMYMNKVNFHPVYVGIEAASKYYFGIPASKVNLEQAAFLAGLPQAPSTYMSNLDQATARRNIVLDNMAKEGYITPQQAEASKNKKVELVKNSSTNKYAINYPHYVEYVLNEAEQKYKIPSAQLLRGGYNIYTDLDQDAQKAVEAGFKNDANFPPNASDGKKVEGAMVLVDPKKGGIRALVGRRDTSSGSFQTGWNYAFQELRQPGSAIKPLIDYGPAIDMKPNEYKPSTLINDKKGTKFGEYQPRDWDNHQQIKRSGDKVSMEEAIKWSFNIPAVQVLKDIDIENGKKYAQKAGIPFDKDDKYLPIAIGGFSKGVSVVNMADSYTAFANKGNRVEAHAIEKITTRTGSVLAQANPETIQVWKEETTRTITKLLQAVVKDGTGQNAKISNRPVAGKTGTTEYENVDKANRDAWFAGYTPEMVAAVWIGFPSDKPGYYLDDNLYAKNGMTASGYASQLFGRIMPQALKNYPIGSFPAAPADTKKADEPEKTALKLSGQFTGNSVALSWTKGKDNTNYAVYRTESLENAEPMPAMLTPDTSWTDTNIEPGKTYYYVVSDGTSSSNTVVINTGNKQQDNKDKDKNKPKPGEPQLPPIPDPGILPPSGGNGGGTQPGTGGTQPGTGGTQPGTGGTQPGTGGTQPGTGGTDPGTGGTDPGAGGSTGGTGGTTGGPAPGGSAYGGTDGDANAQTPRQSTATPPGY